MLAEALLDHGYSAYRARLKVLLDIPESAGSFEIHLRISCGFSAARLMKLADEGVVSPQAIEQIIPLRTLKNRITRNQPLTIEESDRLFRTVHITAMAEAIFGDADKARRWLFKPKKRLSGMMPINLLTTLQGTSQAEEMLLQISEGFVL